MIIKNITLRNIRSYRSPEPIQLTTGVTLFEGDIGSGKSTILSGIEFALFGLGDVDGSYLLRHGEKIGSVLLEFEVNGKQYKVYRSIERKKTSVTQKEGYIVEQGIRTAYSVTEMKNRVLELLNFNECARPKTGSLIYRYAIFTPQEMMKEVLSQPVERRLETLRRAFRIEDYSIIVNNTLVVLSWLESESKVLDRQTRDIGEKRTQFEQENKKMQIITTALGKISSECNLLKDNYVELSAQIKLLQPKKEKILKLDVEIPSMKRELQSKRDQLNENKNRSEKLNNQLSEISNAEKLLVKLSPVYDEYKTKRARISQLEPSIQKIQNLENRKSRLQTAIEKEKTHLEKRIIEIRKEVTKEGEKIAKQKEATAKVPQLLQKEIELSKEVEELPKLAELSTFLNKEHAALAQDAKSKKTRAQELTTELDELRKIGIGAPCPKCKQQLTQLHYAKVEQDYLQEIGKFKETAKDLENKAEKIDLKINETSNEHASLTEQNKVLNKLRQEIAKLNQQDETIKDSEEALNEKRRTLAEHEDLLSKESFAQIERDQLKQTEGELEQLDPDKKEYEILKERIKGLEKERIEEQYLMNNSKIERKETIIQDLGLNERQAETLKVEIENENGILQKKNIEYEKEKPVLETIDKMEKEKEKVDKDHTAKNEELIGIKKDLQRSQEEISRIQSEIDAREDQLLKFQEYKQYQVWLSEFFIPAVKQIETNVLANINSEFNSLFQKWLGHLLETGDIAVRVDDDFTPIIEQNGYEMDVNSLSGGEKTSVALAYRLALNVMVKKVCEAMQSNLLILDEPTDGFSREQLFRLRDILKELNCEQVITVSHESELEGFVDKIYRITKEAGESKISA